MAKKRKRELQHLRQEPARRRSYQLGNTSPKDIYKPGFPMNLLGNVRLFALFGVAVIASMIIAAVLTNRGNDSDAEADDLRTVTPTATVDASATASPSASVTAKTFAAAEQVVDPAKQYTATMKTSKGDIVIQLYADKAPKTVNSFVFLAQKGFFDATIVHRVTSNRFVVQMGSPGGTPNGGPGYTTADEPNQIRNTRGLVSMAKVGAATEFGSQFFINGKDNPSLDYDNPGPKFYPFGEVISGMDVVDKIFDSPKEGEKPNPPITVNAVTIEEK
ncbi:peptidylprolyl isomerase [Candidatus Amarobacter glycogenicus]|uniref:peptidylprolyl isomerase n=1 Tax=Candidatus Amarobacter glycogenicus TaxID=3140699 RepID=UPI0031CCA973